MQTYWQPYRLPRVQLSWVVGLALAGLIATEKLQLEERQAHYDDKLAAARLAQTALDSLQAETRRRGITTDAEVDPSGSGIIGNVISPITSGAGALESKQTTLNPNYAAVVVDWLKALDVSPGDAIAVGVSGSFPAANVAVFAALQTLKLRPFVVTSVAASQWGANRPEFAWLDMEAHLVDAGVFSFRSVAASRGGIGDRGLGLTKEGRDLLDAAIARHALEVVRPKTADDAVAQRMALYDHHAQGAPIVAYINVGGGTVSVGTRVSKKNFEPGINRRAPRAALQLPSVMGEFLQRDVPVIHFTKMRDLAQQFGLPIAPTRRPDVGEGGAFYRYQYNRWLAGAALAVIVLAIAWLFRRPDALRSTANMNSTVAPSVRD